MQAEREGRRFAVTLDAGQWLRVTQVLLNDTRDEQERLRERPDDPYAEDTRKYIAESAVIYATIWEELQKFLDRALAGVSWDDIFGLMPPEEAEKWRKRLGL